MAHVASTTFEADLLAMSDEKRAALITQIMQRLELDPRNNHFGDIIAPLGFNLAGEIKLSQVGDAESHDDLLAKNAEELLLLMHPALNLKWLAAKFPDGPNQKKQEEQLQQRLEAMLTDLAGINGIDTNQLINSFSYGEPYPKYNFKELINALVRPPQSGWDGRKPQLTLDALIAALRLPRGTHIQTIEEYCKNAENRAALGITPSMYETQRDECIEQRRWLFDLYSDYVNDFKQLLGRYSEVSCQNAIDKMREQIRSLSESAVGRAAGLTTPMPELEAEWLKREGIAAREHHILREKLAADARRQELEEIERGIKIAATMLEWATENSQNAQSNLEDARRNLEKATRELAAAQETEIRRRADLEAAQARMPSSKRQQGY